MMHFSCDMCGKPLDGDDPDHHVMHIEIRPRHDALALTESDLEADHLQQVAATLDAAEIAPDLEESEELGLTRLRYDLCARCRRRFAKDPLRAGKRHTFDFSEN